MFRPMSALDVLCAQLTRDLFAIAKFLLDTNNETIYNFNSLSARHQLTLQDHGYGLSRGVPVYSPVFAGTHS